MTLRDQRIRVGIIGLGYWGPKLARNFAGLETANLVIAADLSAGRLEEFAKLFPQVETTQNAADLLGDNVDAVVIATPVHAHYQLAKEALLAGKHVMVEKPIARTSFQAKDLVDLAAERGLKLMVGHTFEYNPAVGAVRQIIQSGELGRIYYVNSTRVNLGLLQPDINVMWDLAPHDLSILCYILGEEPQKVSALGATFVNQESNLQEVVYINLRFPDGILANLRVSWLDPVKQRSITVVGNKKMLVYDDIAEDKVVIFDKGVEIPAHSVTVEEFRASYRHGEETVYPIQWVEPLRAECQHFVDCIRNDCIPRSDGLDGLKIVKILETAQRSLENEGVELKIEY